MVAKLCQDLLDRTLVRHDIKEMLSACCDFFGLLTWQELAGFLTAFDDANADTVEPKIRGCFISHMTGLKFSQHDWLLIELRLENAARLLGDPEQRHPTCAETDEGRAVAWALTTFWRKTRRTELEFAATRHFGIRDCS